MKAIIVIIAGTGIFAFLRIIKIILGKIIHKYPSWQKVYRAYPVIGSIVWIVFVFWLTDFLFKDRIYYPYVLAGIVLVIIGLITWFLLRDVFAGFIFKVQNEMNAGDYIKIGSIAGQIKSMNLTHLELISESGHNIRIPNTRLNRELILAMSTPEGMEEFTIRLLFDKRNTKPEIEEMIKTELVLSPWSNYKNPPLIKLRDEDERTCTYDVVVYTLNYRHFRIVEKTLKHRFENQP
jgi:small-conductance mechanosensitive channel